MFIDKVKIFVKGGDGGNGVVAFRREKYVPYGGPSGGDGGNGGNVILKVDEGLTTLLDFRYKKHYKAPRGEHGQGDNKHGKNAKDLILRVPPGTIVKDAETGEIIGDLLHAEDTLVVARGGRGGRGNARFATATKRAPRFAEKGEPGEERWILLELKLIADVGLVGFPNVGKSTILSRVTHAAPKIADYPFTTIRPNLGVVKIGPGESFVIADIPGLIEGAHKGMGLGYEFLRHIERTKVLVHVLDASGIEGRDPLDDFEKINAELFQYSRVLAERPQIIAANKIDLAEAKHNFPRINKILSQKGYAVFPISAVTGEGLEELIKYIYNKLKEVEKQQVAPVAKDEKTKLYKFKPKTDDYSITKEEDKFVIRGEQIEKLVKMTDFENPEALKRFQRIVRKKGIEKRLVEMGIEEGDVVRIGDIEFEYYRF